MKLINPNPNPILVYSLVYSRAELEVLEMFRVKKEELGTYSFMDAAAEGDHGDEEA